MARRSQRAAPSHCRAAGRPAGARRRSAPRPRAAAEAEKDPAEAAAEGDMDDDEFENADVARRHRGRAEAEAWSRPSTRSPTTTRSCAACRSRTSPNQLQNESLSPSQERKYKKLKDEIIVEVKSLRLNQAAYRFAGRAALRHQQEAGLVRGPPVAPRRQPRRRARGLPAQLPGLGARSALAQPRLEAVRQRAGRISSITRRTASRNCAARSSRWPR